MHDKTHKVARGSSILALAAAIASVPMIANAQTAGDDDAGSDVILVTAQFRSQNLQETPISITAVNAEMLEARNQSDIEDVANRAPNVTLATATAGVGGSQTTNVTIRGIGQDDFNLALEPGVGIYIDDVYYGTSYGSLFDLIDLDRVEILRGPQGTLSGKNSVGGAIRMITAQPSADQDAFAEVSVGSFNRRRFRGGFNATIVPDQLFLRVTALAEAQDGYVTRYDYACFTGDAPDALGNIPSLARGGADSCELGTEGGKNVLALRGALRWEPNDWIDNTLTIDTTRDRSEPSPRVLTFQGNWNGPGYNFLATPAIANPVGNFVPPAGSFYNFGNYCSLHATPSQYCQPAESNLDGWGISNQLNIEFSPSISLKSISAYRSTNTASTSDTDGSPVSRQMQYWAVDYEQFSQELRLSGSIGESLFWTLGGFYFESDALQGGRINLDGIAGTAPFYIPTDFLFNDPVETRSKSAFAHIEFAPVDGLTLTGGIRYTDDFKSYGFTRTFAPGYTPGPVDLAIAATNGAVGEFSGDNVDFRLAANYELSDDLNVYAQFATGYKGGGVNPRPFYLLQVQPFGPETVNSYEVGFKSQFWDRRIRFNASAFYNEFSDIQLTLGICPDFVPTGAPPNCYLPANVGNAEIMGVEGEMEVRLPGDTLLDISASYLDFQFLSVAAGTGIRLTDRPPYVPEFKFSVGLQKEFNLGSGTLTPRIDYQYQSDQYVSTENYPNGRIAGYGLANGRLTYLTEDEDWQISLAVTNIFDEYYALGINDATRPQNNTDDYRMIIPGRPREWSLTLKRYF